MLEDLSKLSLSDLHQMKERRLDELSNLDEVSFNPEHRKFHAGLMKNIERLDSRIYFLIALNKEADKK